MTTTPPDDSGACERCDFIGPLPDVWQQHRDVHRVWHDVARQVKRQIAPVVAAFAELGRTAREQGWDAYVLAPEYEEDPMPDPELIEVGDTVELARKMSTARGPVTRIDHNEHKGIGLHIDGYPPYPLWIGPRHDTWTLTEHIPVMPEESDLEVGHVYEVTTQRGEQHTARWAPIDGIRAGHPWLDDVDQETRYRRGFIVRAREITAEQQRAALDALPGLDTAYPDGYLDELRKDWDES